MRLQVNINFFRLISQPHFPLKTITLLFKINCMKTKLGSQRIMFPLPTVLVVTGTMEKANIVTIAWITMLTGKPATLGIAVGSKGHSGELIKNNGDFSVNLVSAEIMKEADFCGITSGKDTDKFAQSGLTKLASEQIKSPIIQECPINIECRLTQADMTGATNLFKGEILQTHIDEDKIVDPEKAGSLDILKVNPLIYYSGAREYWTLGEKAGKAYEVGKGLK